MNNKPTESRLQQSLFVWYNNTYCLPHHAPRCIIWHTPNEGQQRLVGIGVLPGVSDLTLIHSIQGVPHSVHVYVEVKTPTGKQSLAQVAFMQRVCALGHMYIVCRSLDEFIDGIQAIEKSLCKNIATSAKPLL